MGPLARKFALLVGLSSAIFGAATAQDAVWVRQFGTAGEDAVVAVALDSGGNIYVAGYTDGALPGQTSSGLRDAYIRRYDSGGNEIWTRQFGSAGADVVYGLKIDVTGNAVVGGSTEGTLPGQISAGGADAFVRCYNPNGIIMWTRQFGTSGPDHAFGVGTDNGSNIVLGGTTAGALPGQVSAGSNDAFVRRYDVNGALIWTRQFGTSSADYAYTVGTDGSGNIYTGGRTDGSLPGQVSSGEADAFVRRYDASGTETWTRQFGSVSGDLAIGLAIDAAGNAFVSGYTGGSLPGQTSLGGDDAFVRRYDAGGIEGWTRQFGTPLGDIATAVSTDNAGNLDVAGSTAGTLPGEVSSGEADAFVRRYGTDGTQRWTHQFGTSAVDGAGSVSSKAANVYVAGLTYGTLPGQSSAGARDGFLIKLDQPSCADTTNPDGAEDGPVSGPVHGLEPSIPDPGLRSTVHETNCTTIVPLGL